MSTVPKPLISQSTPVISPSYENELTYEGIEDLYTSGWVIGEPDHFMTKSMVEMVKPILEEHLMSGITKHI